MTYNVRMAYVIAGLGNPGDEYIGTRHNVGRAVLECLAKELGVEFKSQKNHEALEAKSKIGKESVVLSLPETFMNNSGKAIAPYFKSAKGGLDSPKPSAKAVEKLVVVHDDIDLPFGTIKLCFDRGDGGHNGVASIIKALKTRAFVRLRIGVATTLASGKTKKPSGEEAVIKFILGKFTPAQEKDLKKIIKRASEAVQAIVQQGRERAMNEYNQSA